jgi:hypothetical protein
VKKCTIELYQLVSRIDLYQYVSRIELCQSHESSSTNWCHACVQQVPISFMQVMKPVMKITKKSGNVKTRHAKRTTPKDIVCHASSSSSSSISRQSQIMGGHARGNGTCAWRRSCCSRPEPGLASVHAPSRAPLLLPLLRSHNLPLPCVH